MKKMYEKPMAFEEAFVADEYVAFGILNGTWSWKPTLKI